MEKGIWAAGKKVSFNRKQKITDGTLACVVKGTAKPKAGR